MTKEDEQDAISAFLQTADKRPIDPLDPAHPTNAPEGGESGTPIDDEDNVIDTFLGDDEDAQTSPATAADSDDWHPGADLDDPPPDDQGFESELPLEDAPVVLAEVSSDVDDVETDHGPQSQRGPKATAGALLSSLFAGMRQRTTRVRQEPTIPTMRIPIAADEAPATADTVAAAPEGDQPAPRKKISMREGAIMLVVGLIVVAWLLGKGGPDTPIAAIDTPALDSIEIDTAASAQAEVADVELPALDGAPDKRLMTVAVTQPLDFTAGEPEALADEMVLPDLSGSEVAPAITDPIAVGGSPDATALAAPVEAAGIAVPAVSADVDTPAVDTPAEAAQPVSATFIPEGGGEPVQLPTTDANGTPVAAPPVAATPTIAPSATPAPAAPVRRTPPPVARKPDVKVLAVMVPGNCWNCTAAAVLVSNGVESVVASGDRWNGYEITIAGDRVSLSGRGGRWSYLPES